MSLLNAAGSRQALTGRIRGKRSIRYLCMLGVNLKEWMVLFHGEQMEMGSA